MWLSLKLMSVVNLGAVFTCVRKPVSGRSVRFLYSNTSCYPSIYGYGCFLFCDEGRDFGSGCANS